MSTWVGVITFGGEDDRGWQITPLVYTTGVHPGEDEAQAAGNAKARTLMRMSALVARTDEDTDDLKRAAEDVGRYGHAYWNQGQEGRRNAHVYVCELTDEPRI